MSDNIATVRAQAEKEAEALYPKPLREPKNVNQRASNTIYAAFRDGYVRGQVDLASRLTREKIADAITHRPTGQSAADAILALLVDDTQS